MITIYCLEDCPRCDEIKTRSHRRRVMRDREEDMSTAENITELRVNGCFAMEAPVLKVGDNFYEALPVPGRRFLLSRCSGLSS